MTRKFLAPVAAPAFAPTGLTGATTASRYVGATTGGPPTSGTFSTGDWAADTTAPVIWMCTAGGSPGTWATQSPPSWSAPDDGLLAANYDPLAVATQGTLALGRLFLLRVEIRYALTVSNVWLYTQTAGSGSSTGTFVGLYGSNGSKLAGSADIASTMIGAAGFVQCALGSSVALTPGYVFAAYVQNGITSPSFYRCTTPAIFGTAAQYRFAVSGSSGVTTLPSTVTPSTANAVAIWAALS